MSQLRKVTASQRTRIGSHRSYRTVRRLKSTIGIRPAPAPPRRGKSSLGIPAEVEAGPRPRQLAQLGLVAAIPFVGFGFADNAVMIICGDYIDQTFGIMFGLSTLAAAGLGNTVSDVIGVYGT